MVAAAGWKALVAIVGTREGCCTHPYWDTSAAVVAEEGAAVALVYKTAAAAGVVAGTARRRRQRRRMLKRRGRGKQGRGWGGSSCRSAAAVGPPLSRDMDTLRSRS